MMADLVLQLDPSVAREDLCRFIAACYYEPGPEFVEEGLFDSMVEAARRIDPALAALAAPLSGSFAAQNLEALLVDYTRLFLGPIAPLARPNGSFWLGGETTLMQDSTMAVQALYQEGGFDIDEAFHELPDHVAVELEFLYLTIFRRHEAQRAGDGDALRDLTRLQIFAKELPKSLTALSRQDLEAFPVAGVARILEPAIKDIKEIDADAPVRLSVAGCRTGGRHGPRRRTSWRR